MYTGLGRKGKIYDMLFYLNIKIIIDAYYIKFLKETCFISPQSNPDNNRQIELLQSSFT